MNKAQKALPPLFCFGYGFSAQATARLWLSQGGKVFGTTRDADKLKLFRAENIQALHFESIPEDELLSAGAILSSAPPLEDGSDPVLSRYGAQIAHSAAAWIGYLSSSSVYGDAKGEWIDETAPLAPISAQGQRRVSAERAWCALHRDRGLPVHVFRLSGIYGPGRSALQTVLSGQAQCIVKPGQFFNRIHVEDIAATLLASWQKPNPGGLYNLADDEPAPPQDVIAFACELMGQPPPPPLPFDEAKLSPFVRSFYLQNKRLDNRKIKTELGVTLSYPTYREGLRAEWRNLEAARKNNAP